MKINKINSKEINDYQMNSARTSDSKINNESENKIIVSVFQNPQNYINSYPEIYKPELTFVQNCIFYPSYDNQIIQEALPIHTSQHFLNLELIKQKQKHHKRIHNYINSLKPSQNSSYKGSYKLFNYISKGDLVCQSLSGLAKLTYCIITYDFDTAITMIESIEHRTTFEQTILSIIKSYNGLIKLIKNSKILYKTFLDRNKFEFINQQTNKVISPKMSPFILFQYGISKNAETKQQIYNSFKRLSLNQQQSIILTNLQLFHKFLIPIRFSQEINEYYQLILMFLKNTSDPLISNIYIQFLWKCKLISLPDLINYSNKLLSDPQKFIFIQGLVKSFDKSCNLSDMIYYKDKDYEPLLRIMQNFIDEYGDIESATIVANEYCTIELKKYINLQSLAYGICELSGSRQMKRKQIQYEKKEVKQQQLFLNNIKIREQKADIDQKLQNSAKIKQDLDDTNVLSRNIYKINNQATTNNHQMLCYICFKGPHSYQELYVQCMKCSHGGHINHLNTWFNQNNICAKSDCCCVCNI